VSGRALTLPLPVTLMILSVIKAPPRIKYGQSIITMNRLGRLAGDIYDHAGPLPAGAIFDFMVEGMKKMERKLIKT
ncbi:MAG: hypothetical protein J6D22_01200, partial [Pyramidobacter sp.]|nr:hypothetical protein [Pyramidobacter sp.]